MKMKSKTHYKVQNIRSVQDLKLEKARLKMEAVRKEEQIRHNYRNIVDALTLRNLLQVVTNEITTASTAVSTAFSIGKSVFGKFRKKKKQKDKASKEQGHPDETTPAT
jgi:hypothetical protein